MEFNAGKNLRSLYRSSRRTRRGPEARFHTMCRSAAKELRETVTGLVVRRSESLPPPEGKYKVLTPS